MSEAPTSPSAADDAPELEFAMRDQQPAVRNGIIYLAVAMLAPVYMLLAGFNAARLVKGMPGLAVPVGLGAAVLSLATALALTALVLRRRRGAAPRVPARLASAALECTPKGRRAPVRFAFAEVRSFHRQPGVSLQIDSGGEVTTLFDTDFVEAGVLDAVDAAIRQALAARPDGSARLRELTEQQEVTTLFMQRRAYTTNVFLAVLGACFAVELAVGAIGQAPQMIRLGANAPALVREGQLWRLVTAGFLHANFNHILMNATALLSFGAILEKLLGPARFVLVALLASIAGNIASAAVATHTYSVGGSSCVFGLMGALFVVQWQARKRLPLALVIPPRRWAFLLGINGLISLLPGVDLLAHIGGFAAGAALAALLLPGLDLRAPASSAALRLWAAATIALCLGAFAFAFVRARRISPVENARDVAVMLLGSSREPDRVNNANWLLVTTGVADPALLDRAERAQRAAVATMQATAPAKAPALIDTHAWLRFRQGAVDDAVALERRALTLGGNDAHATALGRFLRARARSPGPPVALTFTPDRAQPTQLTVDAGPSARPRVLYLDLGRAGLWRVVVPANADRHRVAFPAVTEPPGELRPLLLDEAGPELDADAGDKLFPRHPQTAALP